MSDKALWFVYCGQAFLDAPIKWERAGKKTLFYFRNPYLPDDLEMVIVKDSYEVSREKIDVFDREWEKLDFSNIF